VIADKPFARSAEEADKVIKLAEEKGLIVTCFQNRRWVSSPTRRLDEERQC
jgi:predicted dehydrogenase